MFQETTNYLSRATLSYEMEFDFEIIALDNNAQERYNDISNKAV